jgi:hypothetical protein
MGEWANRRLARFTVSPYIPFKHIAFSERAELYTQHRLDMSRSSSAFFDVR